MIFEGGRKKPPQKFGSYVKCIYLCSMKKSDIEEIFSDAKLSSNRMSAAEICEITKFVKVSLEIDHQSLEYYYSIPIESLLSNDVTPDFGRMLKDYGWSIDDGREKLILYLNV